MAKAHPRRTGHGQRESKRKKCKKYKERFFKAIGEGDWCKAVHQVQRSSWKDCAWTERTKRIYALAKYRCDVRQGK